MAIEFYKLRLSVGKRYRDGLLTKEMYEGCLDAIDVTEQISTGEFFYGCEV
jgi:hypothetical protein